MYSLPQWDALVSKCATSPKLGAGSSSTFSDGAGDGAGAGAGVGAILMWIMVKLSDATSICLRVITHGYFSYCVGPNAWQGVP